MRVCFAGKKGTTDFFREEHKGFDEVLQSDVALFPFGGETVDYERELKGETKIFESVAMLSKRAQNLLIYGTTTNTRGHRRKSAIVAENGRILGVSDMRYAIDGEGNSGAYLRVYDAKIGRIGVVVAEDLYDVETVKTLTVCGCDFIICPFEEISDRTCAVLLRAYAFLFGVPILCCAQNYSMIADVDSSIVFASPITPIGVNFTIRKEFHLLEWRRKIYLPEKETRP